MIPRTLSDWSVLTIIDFLYKGMFESESFDYKQSLPHSKDDSGKERLRRACCAFANTQGGFIVFGISDDRSQSPEKRIVGLDPNLDFPQNFGNYPRTCHPSVEWNFLNPPLALNSGNVLHIVEVPKSWQAPHATGDRDVGWRFMKRTNQGDEGMTIDEIRLTFLGYYEKRLKLQLLRAELELLKEQAQCAMFSNQNDMQTTVSLITFDLQVIQSIITDTYSITATNVELHKALSNIRHTVVVANNQIRTILGVTYLPLTNKEDLLNQHNTSIQVIQHQLVQLCNIAIVLLERLLGN